MARSREEQVFLEEYDPGAWERPSVAVDVVILTVHEDRLWAVLRRRTEHPDRDRWSLPGGFVGMRESLEAAAQRVLADKAGLSGVFLEQLYTFGQPERDPRMRVISVAYYALVPRAQLDGLNGGSLLAPLSVPWAGEGGGPVAALDATGDPLPLAFDHAEILGTAVLRLRGKLSYTNVAFALLPARFTLRDLRLVHEAILGEPLNKDSFRRKVLASEVVVPSGERQEGVGHRPAALYRFTTAPGGPQTGRK